MFPKSLGFYPYLWLLYIVMPIFNLRYETGIQLLLGYMMIALFIVTYRQLYVVSTQSFPYWLALQMLLLIILSLFYSPYNLYLGFFTANFIGWFTDHRRFNIAMAFFAMILTTLLLLRFGALSTKELFFFLPFFLIMLASPFAIRSLNRKQQLERELHQANKQINELVKRDERMRIARDLHDTLGHTLSLITLKSQLVEKLVHRDPDQAVIEAQEIQRTSRAAMRQVRELVSDMRATSVTEEIAEVHEMLQAANILLQVDGDTTLEGVSDLTHNILSLCIKEAVTNIVKHSQADRCQISLLRSDAEVTLCIEDNGIGMSGPEGLDSLSNLGNGLKGMSERLSLIEGHLHLTPMKERGVRLRIVVPFIIKDRKEGESA